MCASVEGHVGLVAAVISAAWRLGQRAVLSGLAHKSGGRSCREPGPSVRALFPRLPLRGGLGAVGVEAAGPALPLRGAHASSGSRGGGGGPLPSVEGRRRVHALASFNHLKRRISSKDIYEITRSELT